MKDKCRAYTLKGSPCTRVPYKGLKAWSGSLSKTYGKWIIAPSKLYCYDHCWLEGWEKQISRYEQQTHNQVTVSKEMRLL